MKLVFLLLQVSSWQSLQGAPLAGSDPGWLAGSPLWSVSGSKLTQCRAVLCASGQAALCPRQCAFRLGSA